MLAVAGGAMLIRAWRALALHRSALAWPQVAAVVTRSALHERTDGDGTSYKVDISCTYELNGRSYSTARHTEGLSLQDPEATARHLASKYPGGKAVEVSVDPSNPANSVLFTGYPHQATLLRRVGLASVIAGAALLLYGAVSG